MSFGKALCNSDETSCESCRDKAGEYLRLVAEKASASGFLLYRRSSIAKESPSGGVD